MWRGRRERTGGCNGAAAVCRSSEIGYIPHLATVLDHLERYARGQVNEVIQHRTFNMCAQLEGESFDDFATRLRRLREKKLSEVCISAAWRPGKKHAAADALSRAPVATPTVVERQNARPNVDPNMPLTPSNILKLDDSQQLLDLRPAKHRCMDKNGKRQRVEMMLINYGSSKKSQLHLSEIYGGQADVPALNHDHNNLGKPLIDTWLENHTCVTDDQARDIEA